MDTEKCCIFINSMCPYCWTTLCIKEKVSNTRLVLDDNNKKKISGNQQAHTAPLIFTDLRWIRPMAMHNHRYRQTGLCPW